MRRCLQAAPRQQKGAFAAEDFSDICSSFAFRRVPLGTPKQISLASSTVAPQEQRCDVDRLQSAVFFFDAARCPCRFTPAPLIFHYVLPLQKSFCAYAAFRAAPLCLCRPLFVGRSPRAADASRLPPRRCRRFIFRRATPPMLPPCRGRRKKRQPRRRRFRISIRRLVAAVYRFSEYFQAVFAVLRFRGFQFDAAEQLKKMPEQACVSLRHSIHCRISLYAFFAEIAGRFFAFASFSISSFSSG